MLMTVSCIPPTRVDAEYVDSNTESALGSPTHTAAHSDSIWALEWTTQDRLVAGSADGHLRIYDPSQLSKPIHDLTPHPLAISSLSTSSDGSRALSTSLDGTIALTDAVDGKVLGRIDTGREKVGDDLAALPAYAAALHPTSKCFAWSGRSSKVAVRPVVQDWTPASGEENGEASTSRGPLGESGVVVDTGKGKFGMDLAFSPDGLSLALATETGHVVIVDTETQAVTATYTSHAMAVRTIAWSADSQYLFSGSDDNRIVLHDVRAGSTAGASGKGEGAVAVLQGHQGWVLDLDVGADSKLLGSGGADKLVKLWDIGQRTCVSTNTAPDSVWAFAWQPIATETFAAGKQFAVGGDDRAITLYRAAGAV